MTRKVRQYDYDFKVQALKLADEIGATKAAFELGIPKFTMYEWRKAVREGRLDIGGSSHTPQNALSLNGELISLRKRIKELEKANRRLKEENDFLAEASAFFAASRLKSGNIPD